MRKNNEETKVLEAERDYRNNRKSIILKTIKKAKISDKLYKTGVVCVCIFGISVISVISTYLGVVIPDALLGPTVFTGSLSAIAALLCEATGYLNEIEVYEVADKVIANDAAIELKQELNSEETIRYIKTINPRLFDIIQKSKSPINIISIHDYDKKEQEELITAAQEQREAIEERTGLKYINLFKEENKEILKEAKRKKLIK